MYLVGDRLTVTGLKLVGLKKTCIADEKNVVSVLKEIKPKAKIILITQSLSKHARREIEKMRKSGSIVVEIPDRVGGGDTVEKLIQEAVGFEIKK